MAVTFTGAGTATAASGASPQAVTTVTALAVGDALVALIAYDNSGTSGADPMTGTITPTPVTGALGASVSAQTGLNDPGAASAGVAARCVAWKVTTAIPSGTVINFAWSGTIVVRSIALMKVVGAGSTINFRANNAATGVNGVGVTTVAHTTPSVRSGEGVLCWAAHEYGAAITGDADTTNGSWSSVYGANTGSTTSGVAAYFQSKVVTATATQTFNPTGTSSDWIVGSIIFTETVAVTPVTRATSWNVAAVPGGTAVIGAHTYVTNSGTSSTITTPAHSPGDLLVWFMGNTQGQPSPSYQVPDASAGTWVLAGQGTGNYGGYSPNVSVYLRTAGASEPSTFRCNSPGGSQDHSLAMVAVSGAAAAATAAADIEVLTGEHGAGPINLPGVTVPTGGVALAFGHSYPSFGNADPPASGPWATLDNWNPGVSIRFTGTGTTPTCAIPYGDGDAAAALIALAPAPVAAKPAVRTFSAADLQLATGTSSGDTFEPGSFAAVVRRGANGAYHTVLSFQGSGGTTIGHFGASPSNLMTASNEGNQFDGNGPAFAVADGWLLLAWTRSAINTVVRFHKIPLPTGTKVHQDSVANNFHAWLAPGASGKFRIGNNSFTEPFNGDIAGVGVFPTALSDADVEALAVNWDAWVSKGAKHLWVLDQTSTATAVPDSIAGGGATQTALTGTTVLTDAAPIAWASGGGTTSVSTSRATTWNVAAAQVLPPARTFDGTDDGIQMSPGSLVGMTYGTFAVVCRLTNLAYRAMLSIGTSSFGDIFSFGIASDGQWYCFSQSDYSMAVGAPTVGNGWCLCVVTKTAGASSPIMYKEILSSHTRTNTTGNSMGALSGTIGQASFGRSASFQNYWQGDIAGGAIWEDRVLTPTEINTLAANWNAWQTLTPSAMWVLDQASAGTAITDLTGGGANQTSIVGTTATPSIAPLGWEVVTPVSTSRATTWNVAASAPTIFTLTDNFNRANGALGANWASIAGATLPVIVSNAVEATAANTDTAAVVSGTTYAVQSVAADVVLGADYAEAGIVLHAANTTSLLFCVYTTDGTHPSFPGFGNIDGPALQLYYGNGSTYLMVANIAAPGTGTHRLYGIALPGNQIELWFDGKRMLTGTDGGAVARTGKPGITQHYATTPARIDNVAVWSAAAPLDGPTLISFTPSSGVPGETITVVGTGFVTDATEVFLGESGEAVLTVTSSTTGTFVVPNLSPATRGTTIGTPFGFSASLDFTIDPPGPRFGAITEATSASAAPHTSMTVALPSGVTGAANQRVFLMAFVGTVGGAAPDFSPPSGFAAVGALRTDSIISGLGITLHTQWYQSTTDHSGDANLTVGFNGSTYISRLIAGVVNNTTGAVSTPGYATTTGTSQAVPSVTTSVNDSAVLLATILDPGMTVATPTGFTLLAASGTDQAYMNEFRTAVATAGASPTPTVSYTGGTSSVFVALTTGWSAAVSLTSVSTSRATSWNVAVTPSTTPVSTSRATTWNVRGSVATTRATSWRTLATVASSRATSWNVLTPVATTRATSWATRASVATTRATTWHTLVPVAATTRATSWVTRANVATSRLTTWNATQGVLVQRATSWNTNGSLTFVSTTRATSWATRQSIATTRATLWNALATTAPTTRATSWHTLATAVGTRATTWHTRAFVAATRASTWDVLAAVTPTTRATSWVTRALITTTRATSWNVAGLLSFVSTSRSTTWGVREIISTTRATTWTVCTPVTPVTRATSWAVLTPVTPTSRATSWRVRALVETSRVTSWNVAGNLYFVQTDRATSWNTRALVSTPRVTSWVVRSGVTTQRVTSWRVLRTMSTTRTTTWNIASPIFSIVTSRATRWNVAPAAPSFPYLVLYPNSVMYLGNNRIKALYQGNVEIWRSPV